MQSEPTQDFKTTSTNENTSKSLIKEQYGQPNHDQLLPHSLISGEGGDGSRSGHALDTSDAFRRSEHHSQDWELYSLSGEQEIASESLTLDTSFTSNKHANLLGTVRHKGSVEALLENPYHVNEAPINTIPNELLTHILSHLPPASLSAAALVSKRFHDVATTPHAWRIAFSRFFPGPEALENTGDVRIKGENEEKTLVPGIVKTERRDFGRLTALASWRSEYILRTRLLRSLARGKPGQDPHGSPDSPRPGSSLATAVRTYNTGMTATVNHIHATFEGTSNKKRPRIVHGANEMGSASLSDQTTGTLENWGFRDPQAFWQFADRFPGDAQWGLGAGDVVGVPNVMDVSQPYGMVYGEGFPGGSVYYRSTQEMRGRFLAFSIAVSDPKCGIPRIEGAKETICSVWIAKSFEIVSSSNGSIGILSGSSFGVLTAYSLGSNGSKGPRLSRGEITARWVLSPGVPIISIAVDDAVNVQSLSRKRIWAVALNALGEVFYLKSIPTRKPTAFDLKLDESGLEHLAWETGRTVAWQLIETTRRKARSDPYHQAKFDGSYSPRSSWDGMGLNADQVAAETKEIEKYLDFKPKHFQNACEGWDMRRRLEIDFAGSVGAGEAVIVLECGNDEGTFPYITRYTRCHHFETQGKSIGLATQTRADSNSPPTSSIFGGGASPRSTGSYSPLSKSAGSPASIRYELLAADIDEEWRTSILDVSYIKTSEITVSTLDMSTFAQLPASEDPLLQMSGTSATSSPREIQTNVLQPGTNSVPGQRARYLAVGTSSGTVVLWNIRASVSKSAKVTNSISALRVIHTDSPQISSLALSGLYLVHGGNDGLVQAWDPLASNLQPIRTLNSRFSSRARRRLVQAAASPQGVGINLFAAGAIRLDPDPTKLRGVVALGTHIRFWHYSSMDADQYRGRKRRLRKSPRTSNQNGDRFTSTGRSALKDYIANERQELEHDKKQKKREENRLAGRFGVGLLGQGESEEDVLAYARMLSEETFQLDEERRQSESDGFSGDNGSVWSSETVTPEGSIALESSSPIPKEAENVDRDMAEAIRLSLLEDSRNFLLASSSRSTYPFKAAKSGQSPSSSPPRGSAKPFSQKDALEADLDFALQLSLAEERSKVEQADFPGRNLSPEGKGKGRAD